MKRQILLPLILVLVGCGAELDVAGTKVAGGGSAGASQKSTTASYTYSLEENGCKTGEHTFSAKDAYCKGLQSASLNKNCAYSLRKMTFESECPGTFAETD